MTSGTTITVNAGQTAQQMTGFGAALTDASAYVLMSDMNSTQRTALLDQLFSPPVGSPDRSSSSPATPGIGLDVLRIPIGGNDYSQATFTPACGGRDREHIDICDASNNYTEETVPGRFRLSVQDRKFLIPLLRQILHINPNIEVIATPWSAPPWMKCNVSLGRVCVVHANPDLEGGSLRSSDDEAYASYLVDFVQQYDAADVPITALNLDNEPADPNTKLPSMPMTAQQEEVIARDVAAPLSKLTPATQILGLDDNYTTKNISKFAEALLKSPEAADFAGIAFHTYNGAPSNVDALHGTFPHVPIFETESTPTGKNPGAFSADLTNNTTTEVIQGVGNWSQTVMFWNLALDQNDGPTINIHSKANPKGCDRKAPTPCLPVVQVGNGHGLARGAVSYQAAYYVLAQLSSFVAPRAYEINSTLHGTSALQSVAFRNPNGSIVLVALNSNSVGDASVPFTVNYAGDNFSYTLPPDTVASFVWSGLPPGSCDPSSGLMVQITGSNVISYVPKGNWDQQSSDTGIGVVNIEHSSITPTDIATASAVNSCAPNPLTGVTVCTANDNDIYLLRGTNLTNTLTSGGGGTISFSGGNCTDCGVAMNGAANYAMIGESVNGSAGYQMLNLSNDTLSTQFASPAGEISEDPLIDPFRNLLLSPTEDDGFEIINLSSPSSPAFYENPNAGSELDSAAEDCSTGIALAPSEYSDPSSVFVADLTQATYTPGIPAGTWTAPSQNQILSESDLTSGPTGIAVAQGTHTGVVTGEFGGNAVTALSLPTTSGTGTPSIQDYVTCSIGDTPDGSQWVEGDDPHTVTAYQSPNSGDAIALFGNEGATWLARVDLTQLLNAAIVPRDSSGQACASGTIPSSVESFIAVP